MRACVAFISCTGKIHKDTPNKGPSASTGEDCICIISDLFVVRSCLELFCFLSFVSFVLRHLYSGTHRRNPKQL